MKQKNRIAAHPAARSKATSRLNIPDLDQLADVATVQVEHLTTLEFLRRAPHHPTADDLNRFGDRVRRTADAIPLPWLPVTHPKLGVVRVYPLPLLEWVYSQFAGQFGWPQATDTQLLEDGRKKRRHALRQIDEAITDAPPPVKEALKIVIDYLECVTGEKKPEPILRPL
jgi:hypothetical protein